MLEESQPAGNGAILKRVWATCLEYGRLGLMLMNLYIQSRVLMAQNLVLSCRLRIWEAVSLYLKMQIFLIRLSCGLPINECWPTEESPPSACH
ncbi:MAG: hypothetical protein ACREE6_13595 [Limisphaerales bacterium]